MSFISKVAAKASNVALKGVKTVVRKGGETVTTFSKTGTKVLTYDDNALKIIKYGKNSDTFSKFGISQLTIVPKGSKLDKEGMIILNNRNGMSQKFTLQEFGDWMKFLRNHMKKYNLKSLIF